MPVPEKTTAYAMSPDIVAPGKFCGDRRVMELELCIAYLYIPYRDNEYE